MRRAVVAAILLILSTTALADPTTSISGDDPAGNPGENDPAPVADDPPPTPAPTPALPEKTKTKARMSNPPVRQKKLETVKDDGENRLEKKEDTVAGGKHWRIKTKEGAVHVWIPRDYDRETAGTVVYVHGYWTDADGAWQNHELAKQFKASKQNAMFIVPDAPANNDQGVNWPKLTDLRKAVSRANIHLPEGPVVVMGHSGAFRTIMEWVDNRLVDQIILLDAMYGGEKQFDEYVDSGKHADEHKLIVVAASTAMASEQFEKKYKFAVSREKMPESSKDFSKKERRAKLLYIRSQYEHMQIVTSGKVIPQLLHLTPLKAI